MQRNEVFEGTGPTPGSYMKVKIGAKKDGTITAAEKLGKPIGHAGTPRGRGKLRIVHAPVKGTGARSFWPFFGPYLLGFFPGCVSLALLSPLFLHSSVG